jgi:hypothetical protein
VKSEGVALEAPAKAATAPSNARWYGQRVFSRVAAAVSLLGIAALLVWGARWQERRHNPFETPGLFSWLLTPDPHRGYREIPVVPLGSRLGLSPRGLCAKPDDCGGLKTMPDGQTHFRDDNGIDRIAVRLHRSSTSGHVLALTSSGELFALADEKPQVWRQIALPDQPPAEPLVLSHAADPFSVNFSPDGSKIVTGSRDNTARLWDGATGKPIGEALLGHEGSVLSAAFSPDGKRVVTGSNDTTARLWDAESGKEIAVLKGHVSGVMSAAFSPDGKRVVTAAFDNTARLWEAESGKEIAVLVHRDWALRTRPGAIAPGRGLSG